jgi:hypothetical protein
VSAQEWTTIDKSTWGNGAWQNEPDKIQWVDEATNLDCLMVRNPHGGFWCGYVGVPEGHPAFAKEYEHVDVNAHGGLTYSDFCTEATRESWERWRVAMHNRKAEVAKYPIGDSARAWREDGHLIDDYEGWRQRNEARAICHVPVPGRPHRVWWLGFDCAHLYDATPGYSHQEPSDDTYKTRFYVESEVTSLAAQLAVPA